MMRQRGVRELVVGLVVLSLLTVLVLVIVRVADGETRAAWAQGFGFVVGGILLVAFTALIAGFAEVRGFVVGKDGRISTSKLQVVLWTYAVAFGLLSLIAMTWAGQNAGFDAITDSDFNFEGYLVLLGGPFLAAVSARYLTGVKVESGDLAKPPAMRTARLRDAVVDDSEKTDVVDSQYLLFNAIALIYFFGQLISEPTEGLPVIPPILYVLTGAAAATYVANKAVVSSAPTMAGLHPQTVTRGHTVTAFAANLLFPTGARTEAMTKEEVDSSFLKAFATVDGRAVDIVKAFHQPSGDDRLVLSIPDDFPLPARKSEDTVEVILANFRGVQSAPKSVKVLAG